MERRRSVISACHDRVARADPHPTNGAAPFVGATRGRAAGVLAYQVARNRRARDLTGEGTVVVYVPWYLREA